MRSGRNQQWTTWRLMGLVVVIAFFAVGGLAHFVFAAGEIAIIPPYVPWPRAINYVTGIFELLGAIGLMHAKTRRVAGIGLVFLTIAVTPANLYMLQESAHFPEVPMWALIMRLPLQIVLILLIGWSSGVFLNRPRHAFIR